MSRLPGIDVSHFQGDIDYDVLATKPVDFNIIKATQNAKNPKFDRNWAESKRIGLTRGAYHLIDLDKEPEPQLFMYLSVVTFEEGDLPPVLDVETSKIEEVGDPELAYQRILWWLMEAERLTGTVPILYISPRGLDKLDGNTEGLDRFHLWAVDREDPEPGLTQQPAPHPPFETWLMWQWSSDGPGKDYGMESEGLDMNYYNGCRHDLEELVMLVPQNPWNIDVQEAQTYNNGRGYDRQLIYDIITLVDANPWYEDDIVYKIAYWQYQHGDLDIDGKVGPATLAAMEEAGLGDVSP